MTKETGPWIPHDILIGPVQRYCVICRKELRDYPENEKCVTLKKFGRMQNEGRI